jgi:outer membrane protein assembly factor BamB
MKKLMIIIFCCLRVLSLTGQQDREWYIFRGDPTLHGVSGESLPAKPELYWSYRAGEEFITSPVTSGDRMVAGSMDGTVFCLDTGGQLQWKCGTGNGIEAPALIHNGNVYVGDLDGTMYCLDLQTGREHWTYRADNQISGSPNLWVSGVTTLIVFGSYDFYLHCLDASNGGMVWKYETDNFINGAAACDRGKAIFGGCDGYIHIVDILTGRLDKKINLATYIASSVAVSDGLAYTGDHDGKFSCVDLEHDKIVWTWTNDRAHLPFLASPSVNQRVAVIGNEDKYTYCFDRSTGELLWRFNTGARIHASPVISGDRVLVANLRGDVFILDIRNGEALWSYELGSAITGNPAVSGGRIFIAASDGYIYCFEK